MKLKNFRNAHLIKKGLLINLIGYSFYLYRSLAWYEDQNLFDIISGSAPDQNYDVMYSFVLIENGHEKMVEELPVKDYTVEVLCNEDVSGYWDYD